MSEYNSPIEYGLAQPAGFFTKYPPIVGRINCNPADWGFGGINLYPRPFNSWYQQVNSGNNYLGPFARRMSDGKSGRIKMSMGGEIGFVEQCWYDFPRGNFDTDSNGQKYPENREFWAQADLCEVTVYNLMTTGPTWVDVEVAISNTRDDDGTSSDPYTWSNEAYGGGFFRYIKAAVDIFSGSVHGMPGDTSTCGVGDVSGQTSGTLPADGGSLSFAEGMELGGLGYFIGPDGELEKLVGPIYDALDASAQADVGTELNAANRGNWFSTWWAETMSDFADFLTALKADQDAFLNLDAVVRAVKLDETAHLLSAIGIGRNLMIRGWYIPNIEQVSGLPNSGTASDPYKLRPRDAIQQRWAGYLRSTSTGAPDMITGHTDGTAAYGDFRDYIPHTTPNASFNGVTREDMDWKVTLLNRGDKTSVPFIDPNENEFVFRETYGFGRGGSVSSSDPFLNWVDNTFSEGVGDSLGVLLDMSPASPFFVFLIGPIVRLENTARLLKKHRGEPIHTAFGMGGPIGTNLDGYRNTVFEVRISAENLKAGNPDMYNYLVNTGDANGNKLKAVP